MNQVVMVPIPLSVEAAHMLRDNPGELSLARQLHSRKGEADPLVALLAGLKRERGVPRMTEAEITVEIAAARAHAQS